MGEPVYLECWVKVLPKWRRNPAALARFGFPDAQERAR
jgi:GTPase Era involved in 16S rRNA processing